MLATVIVLLVIYQLKHFLADYPLQGPYMLKKFLGGWDWVKPLAAHAGVHATFTYFISITYLFFYPIKDPGLFTGTLFCFGLAAFDFTVHFCMDRLKASPNLLGRFKALSANEFKDIMLLNHPDAKARIKGNTYFWWSLGLDQMVHHLTHYIIIWLLVA